MRLFRREDVASAVLVRQAAPNFQQVLLDLDSVQELAGPLQRLDLRAYVYGRVGGRAVASTGASVQLFPRARAKLALGTDVGFFS